MKKKSNKKPKTKEEVYFSYVRRGDDRCYAQWRADEWEKRQAQKKMEGLEVNNENT